MFKCQYCNKEFETKQKLGGHSVHCKKNPNYNEEKEKKQLELARESKIQDGNYIQKNKGKKKKCQYCGEEHFIYGLKNHEKHCHLNPNRTPGNCNFNKNNSGTSWNKGLTKDNDPRVAKCVNSRKQNYIEGKFKNWSQGLRKDNDSRIAKLSNKVSQTIKEKVKNGEWHCSFSKSRTYQYKGITLHGSWELNFVKYLDEKSIEWKRPNKSFQYFWNNEYHEYFPDLYLPQYDLYIEIKGYPTERDFCKWEQFPNNEKLDIYFGDELLSAKIINECKDVYNNIEKFRKKNYNLLR